MVEPRIHYAKTSDGVNIAYWTLGEGKPFVAMPAHPWSHIGEGWQDPEIRNWCERLAQNRMLVVYDGRGTGLSDRDVLDQSLDSLQLDLQAVADRLQLKTFALQGGNNAGPVAISYAARHPQRVSHLLLVHTWARSEDVYRSSQYQAFKALRDVDWNTYTETAARAMLGWSDDARGSLGAAFLRKCVSQEVAHAAYAAILGFDVTDLLSQVTAPTLVLHRLDYSLLEVSLARELAARIPDARLALLEGSEPVLWLGDTDAAFLAMDEFLTEGQQGEGPRQPVGEDIHTILFTDIEGSTALTERLGDAKAQGLRRAHDTIVREALKGCSGTETKHTGDGIMASFPSASRAIECAVAVQRAIAERDDATLNVRIGLNAGEPVAEEADLFGTAVNLARRICDRAEPGQILVSDVVHQLAAGKGFTFTDNGEATLKGFEKPVRLFEVRWHDD